MATSIALTFFLLQAPQRLDLVGNFPPDVLGAPGDRLRRRKRRSSGPPLAFRGAGV